MAGHDRRAGRPALPRHRARRRPARPARPPSCSGSRASGWRPGSRGGRERCPARLLSLCRRHQRRSRQHAVRCRHLPPRHAAGCHRPAGASHPAPAAMPSAGAGAAVAAPRRPLQPRHRSRHRRGPAAHWRGRRGPCHPYHHTHQPPAASQVALLSRQGLRRRWRRCWRLWHGGAVEDSAPLSTTLQGH